MEDKKKGLIVLGVGAAVALPLVLLGRKAKAAPGETPPGTFEYRPEALNENLPSTYSSGRAIGEYIKVVVTDLPDIRCDIGELEVISI